MIVSLDIRKMLPRLTLKLPGTSEKQLLKRVRIYKQYTLSDQFVFANPRSRKEQQLFNSTAADSSFDGDFGD